MSSHQNKEHNHELCKKCGKCDMCFPDCPPKPQEKKECKCDDLQNGDIIVWDKDKQCVVCKKDYKKLMVSHQEPLREEYGKDVWKCDKCGYTIILGGERTTTHVCSPQEVTPEEMESQNIMKETMSESWEYKYWEVNWDRDDMLAFIKDEIEKAREEEFDRGYETGRSGF